MRISDWSSDVCSADLIEITFGTINDEFPESAQVWLGGSVTGGVFDPTGADLFGELFNDGTAPTFDATLGPIPQRSAERRVGKACVSPSRPRWPPSLYKPHTTHSHPPYSPSPSS